MQNSTMFWSRLLGLYAVIMAIWCFLNANSLFPMLTNLTNNPLMMLNFGVFALLIGLAIVVTHSVFHGWPLIVTLLGYYAVLKGIALLFCPHWVSNVVASWHDQPTMFSGLPTFIIGVLLLYVGFVRHSAPRSY